MALTHIVHKEHPLGQILVQEHIFHPEVQWGEETNFILGWKLAHISNSKGRHREQAQGTQGAGTGLLPVGRGKVILPTQPPSGPRLAPSPTSISITVSFFSVPGIGWMRGYVEA